MKTKIRAALTVAAFIFLLTLSARSEIKAGSFEVTPLGGYNFFEDDQNLEDSPLIGSRICYNFTKNSGLEPVVEYMRTNVDDRTISGVKEGQCRSPMDHVDFAFYYFAAIYHFIPEGNLNPFVTMGFGRSHSGPDISANDMAAFNFGVGLKYWLAKNMALRIDVWDNMVTEIFQESYHNVSVLAGITFAFGGEPKAEAVPVAKHESKYEPEKGSVIILVSDPKAEEKVMVAASEPIHEEKVVILR